MTSLRNLKPQLQPQAPVVGTVLGGGTIKQDYTDSCSALATHEARSLHGSLGADIGRGQFVGKWLNELWHDLWPKLRQPCGPWCRGARSVPTGRDTRPLGLGSSTRNWAENKSLVFAAGHA